MTWFQVVRPAKVVLRAGHSPGVKCSTAFNATWNFTDTTTWNLVIPYVLYYMKYKLKAGHIPSLPCTTTCYSRLNMPSDHIPNFTCTATWNLAISKFHAQYNLESGHIYMHYNLEFHHILCFTFTTICNQVISQVPRVRQLGIPSSTCTTTKNLTIFQVKYGLKLGIWQYPNFYMHYNLESGHIPHLNLLQLGIPSLTCTSNYNLTISLN